MRYWWVNQNQTYRQETEGGYLWAPKRRRDGARNPFYDFMREVAPGDIVFSFADTWIRKIGIAEDYCRECPKPAEFGAAGRAWDDIGWRVRVRFFELDQPIRPRDWMPQLRPHLTERHSPLRADGGGNQIYLAAIPDALALALGGIIGRQFEQLSATARTFSQGANTGIYAQDEDVRSWESHEEAQVEQAAELPETEREALIQARVGQGLFRENVFRIENRCRVTGVTDPAHLRASHTKPWRSSSHDERLNGENGLLLTPSIDHLFDRGFISFEDQGTLLVSPIANHDALERMGVPCTRTIRVGQFSTGQAHFLEYHRNNIFLSRRTG